MEKKLYSFIPSVTWVSSILVSLVIAKAYWGDLQTPSMNLFAISFLLAIAVDQTMTLIPKWVQFFSKSFYINAFKVVFFILLTAPAFSLMTKGGFQFVLLMGLSAFVLNELLDQIKQIWNHIERPSQKKAPLTIIPSVPKGVEKSNVPQHQPHRHFEGKTILITGVGKHDFATEIINSEPAHLILIGDDVQKLTETCQTLEDRSPSIRITPHLKLPEHRTQLQHIFEAQCPQIIIHGNFETISTLLDENPSFTAHLNVIETMDWVDMARKNGVEEFALLVPSNTSSSVATQCLQIIQNYVRALLTEASYHPTKLLSVEGKTGEDLISLYLTCLSDPSPQTTITDFPTFMRALHRIERAINDLNNEEVKGLLNALAPTPLSYQEKIAA